MIGSPKEVIEWLFNQPQDKEYQIDQYRRKRSLNANAYAWVLITKLADLHRVTKEKMYIHELKRYGQSEMISVLSNINVSGYFKYYEPVATATLQGKEFTHYRIYKGSSEYDSREMAVLIDGIVSDCKECDIETLPPAEIERLKELWK